MAAIRSRVCGELSVMRLEGAHCALEVAPQGAHLIDWTLPDTPPVLFTSPDSAFLPGKAIRGGVPLAFPWFGPNRGDARAPQHGFARVRDWSVRTMLIGPDGNCVVAMVLADDERTRAAWPHAFAARFTASAGRSLRMALEIRNSGDTPFTFEAALHSYFAVSDVREVRLHGLQGIEYVDKAGGGSARRREGAAPLRLVGETDRVYLDTEATCIIDDPGWRRRIAIAKSGSRTTVVWNPWAEKARAMADLGGRAWTGMVCVETVVAGDDARTLDPGEAHSLAATITVEQAM